MGSVLAIVVLFGAARIIFEFQNNQTSMCLLSLGLTLPLVVLVFIAYGAADRG
jgi:hypothetical protein